MKTISKIEKSIMYDYSKIQSDLIYEIFDNIQHGINVN